MVQEYLILFKIHEYIILVIIVIYHNTIWRFYDVFKRLHNEYKMVYYNDKQCIIVNII